MGSMAQPEVVGSILTSTHSVDCIVPTLRRVVVKCPSKSTGEPRRLYLSRLRKVVSPLGSFITQTSQCSRIWIKLRIKSQDLRQLQLLLTKGKPIVAIIFRLIVYITSICGESRSSRAPFPHEPLNQFPFKDWGSPLCISIRVLSSSHQTFHRPEDFGMGVIMFYPNLPALYLTLAPSASR